MKSIIMTGANGFVGSYFKSKYADKYNIQTFSFLKDDFNSLNVNHTDVIIYLSALVHQMGGATKEEYEKVNVTQTLELAKKAEESGVKHFIFMSSIKVYGEETNVAYSETSTCKPKDVYGKSKLKAENELRKLESDAFKVSIIRTPIVYGYGVKANIKNLMSLIQKVPLLPFGNIQNKRSMIYIGNLCHLVDVIIEKKESGVFLAADDKPLSTTKLIELIAQELDRKVYLLNIPLFPWLLKKLKPSFYKRLYESLEVDNTKTKEILNFQNPYSVEEGIKLMLHGELV